MLKKQFPIKVIYRYLNFLVILVILQGSYNLYASWQPHNGAGRELPQFGLNEGLSNNSVTVLFQDDDGFLWIGTEDGLNRYDGYEFRTFRHDPSDEYSISGNYIQTIMEDEEGNLWIGTRNSGLNKLDHSTGEFVSYISSDSKSSLPENSVYGIIEDAKGRVWVKTLNYISLFKSDSAGFENYGHYNNVFNVVEATRYPLYFESDSSLLLGTKDGINRFNTENKQFTRITSQHAVFDFLPYGNNKFLFASSSGVKSLDMNGTSLVEPFGAYGEKSNIGQVSELLERKNGEILAGTRRGIKAYQGASEEVHPFFKEGVLESYHITALLEDQSGIIWVGTKYNGFLKLDLSPLKFNSVSRKNPIGPDTLSSYNFQSVFQDGEGHLWLGTLNEGVWKYHPEQDIFKQYVLADEDFESNKTAVYGLYHDQTGRLWAGTNNGLYYYSAGMDHFLKFEKKSSDGAIRILNRNNVYALAEGFDGDLWIGTHFGLFRYDGHKITSYFNDAESDEGVFADKINALCADEDGNVWVGTSGGLNVWDRDKEQFLRISFSNRNTALKNVSILSLALDHEGNILAGTRSGLWIVTGKSGSAILIPGTGNLDNDMIKSVITDASDQIWVGTNKGVAGIKPDGTVHNFDVFDGLPGYIFNNNSVFRNRGGTLFFGSTEGLAWFHPDSIPYNQTKPSVALTDIRVVRRNQKTEVFWPDRESLEIKYRPFTNIRVEFSALEFTNPKRNKYKVFLQGYDADWRSVTYENSVSFSNLLPGDYTLKILGSNNDYTWSDAPLELEIDVVPPLWMSNYALAFYVLAFIFILHLFINYRVRHYRKANRELQEKTVNKKQIEAQREVLTRINRSLTDSINYARRIQRAMIPAEDSFQSLFPEAFVYLRARDIVSGDFYWFHEKDNKVFVTAVDCTGHGVPGAFMSIIGLDLLKNIVEVQGLESPSEILKTMNGELIRTLHREQPAVSSTDNVSDGMDMSLVVIDREAKTLEFAGAYNGFYLVRDNEIHDYKGDRFPVGYLKDGESPVFTRKKVEIKEGDVVYLFSDGIPDQFGGSDHKKFKYRRFRLLLLSIHQMAFTDQKAIIHQKIEEWMAGDHEQVDDMLVLGFKPLG